MENTGDFEQQRPRLTDRRRLISDLERDGRLTQSHFTIPTSGDKVDNYIQMEAFRQDQRDTPADTLKKALFIGTALFLFLLAIMALVLGIQSKIEIRDSAGLN